MRFLGESMMQNNQAISIKEAEQTKNIISVLDANLPNIIGCFQLFEKLARYDVNRFYQIENKEYLFNLFVGEGLKVILHRAFAVFKMVENYFSHEVKLAQVRTKGNDKFLTICNI